MMKYVISCVINVAYLLHIVQGPGVRFELLVSPGYPDIPQVLITELGSQRREIFLQRSISTLLTSVFLRCPKCASSSSKDCGQHAMWTL